jgi:predicted RNA-binding Zn-ribbon protein involved in translation (DUF1610 family)
MRQSEFTPSQPGFGHPTCPNCGTRMWLARIEPDKPDHDLRTFECPQCDHTETVVTKYK